MSGISAQTPFRGEGDDRLRLGSDDRGRARVAVGGHEDHHLTGARAALRTLVTGAKPPAPIRRAAPGLRRTFPSSALSFSSLLPRGSS